MRFILYAYAYIIIIHTLKNGRYLRTIFSITKLKPNGNSKIVVFYAIYYVIPFGAKMDKLFAF